ncbi:MAG TPA: hypothetical protein VGK67_33330 [Myxococcales bacterium]|jgi:hypothetical protein
MNDTHVKGVALAHFREFALQKVGEKGLEEIAATLSPAAAKAFTSPAACDWYELAAIVEIEHALARRLFNGDETAAAQLGEYDVEESISKVYRILFRLLDPATIIKKSGQLWSRFYDRGEVRVELLGPRRALVHVSGHGPREEIHCHEIRGGLLGCIKVCGIKTGKAEHTACVLKGAPACTYELTW